MSNLAKMISLLLCSLSLSACGSTRTDRALSGAAIGAGVGAVGAAVLDGNPVTGAVVGGAVGAGAGALSK